MCLYPKLIRNPKYRPNKKNGGVIPAVSDARALHVPIGCQKCIECRKQKAREWQLRLQEDIKHNRGGKFITLTLSNESLRNIHREIPFEKKIIRKGYNNDGSTKETTKNVKIEGYDRDNAIATYAVRHFLERWRKKYGKSLRHWLVTELGHKGTENLHLHGIVWMPTDWVETWTYFMDEVEKIWNYGYTWKYKIERNKITGITQKNNYVSDVTISYCVKYVSKIDNDHKAYKSQILTSPGIGNGYTKNGLGDWTRNKYKGIDTNECYRTRTGHKMALPMYWRNKIYSEEEKEKLWLQKLDKQERWVCGERIDISKGDKEYYKLLDYYRAINDKLGYGNDKINWTRAKYEHERRMIMQSKRLGYPIEWDIAGAKLLAAGQ